MSAISSHSSADRRHTGSGITSGFLPVICSSSSAPSWSRTEIARKSFVQRRIFRIFAAFGKRLTAFGTVHNVFSFIFAFYFFISIIFTFLRQMTAFSRFFAANAGIRYHTAESDINKNQIPLHRRPWRRFHQTPQAFDFTRAKPGFHLRASADFTPLRAI